MKWREELPQHLFDIKPSGISHLHKCCFHYNAFVILTSIYLFWFKTELKKSVVFRHYIEIV